MTQNTTSSGGISFFGLLGVAFIVLKITGFIDWSWFWVLAPLWIPFGIVAVILAGIALIAGFAFCLDKSK